MNCLKDHCGGVGEFCFGSHARDFTYVAHYLTTPIVVCYIGWQENTMLEVQNLSKHYRGIPAVDDVSFSVAAGEIVGYLGPNGSGKSTTVKIITGILQANKGRVLFEGHDIQDDMQGFRAT